jgi:DNA-binding HxlR family transcriptional regulator
MKLSSLLEVPSIRILIFLDEKGGEARYGDLAKFIASRGTLSMNLKDLEEERLIKRRIVETKPIQAYYTLTAKGFEITRRLKEIKTIIRE